MNVRKLLALSLTLNVFTGATTAIGAELARVGDTVITDKDLRAALSNFNEGQKAQILKDANSRRQILASLIDQEVLLNEAVKSKLDQDAEYKEAIQNFRKQFLASRVLQKNLGNKLSDSAVKAYYQANKSRYSTDQVHAMHILVSDEERAKEMLKLARDPKSDFQALAEKHSKDPSAKNNRGDLGYFGRDRMVPEFTEAAFAAVKGQIVGPVKTDYGYHIIKVIDKKPGSIMEFADVEGRVRSELRADLTQTYLGNLRKAAKIKVNDAAIDKM